MDHAGVVKVEDHISACIARTLRKKFYKSWFFFPVEIHFLDKLLP